MRDHKRPIFIYLEIFNSLTEEEWIRRKLPPLDTVRHSPNVQLPDLLIPSFLQAGDDAMPGSARDNVGIGLNVLQTTDGSDVCRVPRSDEVVSTLFVCPN